MSSRLTVKQLACEMEISTRTVYRRVADGEFPAYRVGRQLRFDRDEVLNAVRINAATPVEK